MGMAERVFIEPEDMLEILKTLRRASEPNSVYVLAPVGKHYTGQHDQSTHGSWAHGQHNENMVHDFHQWPEYQKFVSVAASHMGHYIGHHSTRLISDFYLYVSYDSPFADLNEAFAVLDAKAAEEAAKMNNWSDEMPERVDGMDMREVWRKAVVRGAIDEAWAEHLWNNRDVDGFDNTLQEIDYLREQGKVCIATDESSALDILFGGEFLNQFDVGSSNGMYNPSSRRGGEARGMAIPTDAASANRPIYGYLAENELQAIGSQSLEQYGPVRFVLKDKVKARSTMVVGDSLNTGAKPVPITGQVSDRQIFGSFGNNNPWNNNGEFDPESFQVYDLLYDGYAEAQIFGGVALDDIESIVVTNGLDANAFEGFGIPVEVA